jgi:hypothetical protein
VHRTTTHSPSATEFSVVILASGKLVFISTQYRPHDSTPYLSAVILALLGEAACRRVAIAAIERLMELLGDAPIGLGDVQALVTYFAEFTMLPSGQEAHGKIVVGEVWAKRGNEWKAIYAQGSALK